MNQIFAPDTACSRCSTTMAGIIVPMVKSVRRVFCRY
ncbi:hypothetical protein EHW99_1534 [Erwinia amylovora]|uniref:Uncharacterized protein n=2 Tax=Erwinia amylovora TaxID=552 RepID=A0A831A5D6_ERWAM|nr:hypothetical protein EaACW_2065 [Erwinia amylovora ACW56400]QJQ54238.1 hypothetical protein EHX00_1534 [Erwinia amylovora]CBA21003.1 hypothetical protein predicted by Glimmer/Critica [Erwinia amylovora CFBP1430]CCO78910.1 hypothetical protein BN432_2115 [Erwinia amylovora Ea356]CCO82708.1 hypothetical protein BN433_2140 [Erwinia amylovora Ea266]CCO86489.1 hypothetical protein BN434_2103 [Erwinia amylovora CFBP 2585]CCO90275.1 hypothetical protein BN435_2107 [Erwinia amylovora 01SFR-BO]CCO